MRIDKAKREAIAATLVIATTLGGFHLHKAAASVPTPSARPQQVAVPKAAGPPDPFAYGDLLDAVRYQLGFEPDARNAAQLEQACRALLAVEPPAGELGAAGDPIVRYCHNRDESLAERAADAFVAYRELAFSLRD